MVPAAAARGPAVTHTQAEHLRARVPRRPRRGSTPPFIRMGTLLGRNAALVWFWDYTNLNSIRALPYVREWHNRYAVARPAGDRRPLARSSSSARTPPVVEAAAARLDDPLPDRRRHRLRDLASVRDRGWPSLYLWDRRGTLRHHHFAEGAYDETELAIHDRAPRDRPGPRAARRRCRRCAPPTRPARSSSPPRPHQYLEPDRSGRPIGPGEQLSVRYAGAGAAAVLDGRGGVEVLLNGEWINTFELDGPRLYEIVDTGHHQRARADARVRGARDGLRLQLRPGPALRRP